MPRSRKDVLEVVEHEQRLLLAQMRREALPRRRVGLEAERPCNGGRHELLVGDRAELDEDDAVAKLVEQLPAELDGEPGLAASAGAGQGQQANLGGAKQLRELCELLRSADQWRRRPGQARPC